MNKVAICFGLVALSCVAVFTLDAVAADAAVKKDETEAGIPVTDKLVIEKCGACHEADDKGNMSRISWSRTTPEGWAQVIRRMVRLNGVALEAEEGRAIVKYLATYHGLAPEEAKPVMYVPEKRIVDEPNLPEEIVRDTCSRCHEFGRATSWRRTKNEWKLLENLHVAMFAQADAGFRTPIRWGAPGGGGPSGETGGPKPKRPGEAALEYLAKAAPLHTPEWTAWRSRIRAPRIAGKWYVSATVPGQGKYVGELTISPTEVPDEFRTEVNLRSVATGAKMTRSGTGLVYAGYSWRGRSKGNGAPSRPDDTMSETRETLWFAPDQSFAEGRWYWGEYNEFGFDVRLERAGAAAAVLGVSPATVKAGAKGVQLKISGANFPAALAAADLDLGAGVTVNRIVSGTATDLVAEVDIDDAAVSGKRDIALGGSVVEKAFGVYRKIDNIVVTPETGLARLGGAGNFAKGYQQFEAIGYENGPDAKANTADDIAIGPVEVSWSVEEFLSVYGDDDREFVGALDQRGLFTPALHGPNPKRKFGRNNYGDVWVVATAKTEKDKDGKAVSGRSRLVVTVPSYMRWDQPEVNR
ncbi:MAG: quinohemoprotein amine dehydrogenase subunit alpha [Rhodospirillaceae bacterium]